MYETSLYKKFSLFIGHIGTPKVFTVRDTWRNLKSCDVLLVSHENNRSYDFQGKRVSHLLDSVRYYLEKESINCDAVSLPFDSQGESTNHYGDKTVNYLFLNQIISCGLRSLFTLKHSFTQIRHHGYVKAWMKILEKCQPKIVIAIQPRSYLCEACHKKGIKIYDFQHGVIDETIPGYSSIVTEKIKKEYLPTGYFCWNEDSANTLQKWCTRKGLDVLVLGNPWLSRFQLKEDQDDIVQYALKNEPPFDINKKTILISLQWRLDYWYPQFFTASEFISPELLNVIRNSGDEINWLLRLHPIQMKQKKIIEIIKNEFNGLDNVKIEWPSRVPLPVVLTYVHGHITWDSSTVIEAALFNVKNFVLNPKGFSPFQASDEKKVTRSPIQQLPYTFEENQGLVERSKEQPDKDQINKWVNALTDDFTKLEHESFFDTASLVKIVKQ